jgi:membrane protein DedA with SNARE-associated domain
MDWFTGFFDWMGALPPLWAYLTLFAVAYGENIVPPIPGDMVVVFGGYLAGIGKLNLLACIGLSTVGGAVGFMTMYAIGYRVGKAVTTSDRYSWLPQSGFEKARRWMNRYGYGVVAANRFLSGARSVISLTVGMAEMSPWKTAWWCTFSSAVWCALITYAGFTVGENWEIIAVYLRAYGRIVIGLLLFGGLAYALYRYRDRIFQGDDARPGT